MNKIDNEISQNLELIPLDKDDDFNNIHKKVKNNEIKSFKFKNDYYENSKYVVIQNEKNIKQLGEAFLRIKLNKGDKITEILDKIKYSYFSYILENRNSTLINMNFFQRLPLRFFYNLCEFFNRNIELYDPQKKYNISYSSSRLDYDSFNNIYLDIPILFENFSYKPTNLQVLYNTDVKYTLDHFPLDNDCYMVFGKIETIPEKIYKSISSKKTMEYLLRIRNVSFKNPKNFIYQRIPNKNSTRNFLKFIFIFIKGESRPTINKFSVLTLDNKTIEYDPTNFFASYFDNLSIYCIGMDKNSNVKKWMNFNSDMKINHRVLTKCQSFNIGISEYVGNINLDIATVIQSTYKVNNGAIIAYNKFT
ncbi:MAG: hypothetical protein CMF62_03450 [Magnetococcales bacterium]|nr:hypothetical protein [Magnetococcales bacterium]